MYFPTKVQPKAASHCEGGWTFQALSRVLLPYKTYVLIFAGYLRRLLIKWIFNLAMNAVDTFLKLQRFSHKDRINSWVF